MAKVLGEFATPFLGVDRSEKARPGAKSSQGKHGPNAAWFADCYSHSNLSVLGVYITHKPISPNPATAYTDASAHVGNNWTRSWPELLQQGWGAVFIYAGYTTKAIIVKGKVLHETSETKHNIRPKDFGKPGKPQTYGILHAQHLKTAIAEFYATYGVDNDGPVVFLDNEGGKLALDTDLLAYYAAFFDELRKPGPKECQPARPGVYAWGSNSSELLRLHPDLFVWWLHDRFDEVAVRKNDDELYPIPKESKDFLYLEPTKFPIRSASFNTSSGENIVLLPTGIQGLLNYCKDPWAAQKLKGWIDQGSPPSNKPKYNSFPNLPRRSITNEFLPMTPWDLDMSLVRDPRYPQASPRLLVDPAGGAIIRGTYAKPEKRMDVEVLEAGVTTVIQGIHLEADAPLIAPGESTVAAIDLSGNIALSTRNSLGKWSPFASMLFTVANPAPRRARTLAGAALPDHSVHIFFVARDQTLHTTSRASPNSPWTGPRPLHDHRVHGFTTLIATIAAGSSRTISLIHISEDGLLSQSDYTPPSSSKVAPTVKFSYIEALTAGSLLKKATLRTILGELCLGTALTTIRPHPSATIVFGIHRRSLLLTLIVHNITTDTWTPPTQLGTSPDHKLFAHSRLAASQPNPSNPLHVQIAAVTSAGVPAIFNVVGTPSPTPGAAPTWGLAPKPGPMPPMQTLPRVRPSKRAAPEPAGTVSSLQWSINPFSDIHFGLDPTFNAKSAPSGTLANRVLVMAGTGPDIAVGVLFRRIARPSEDWFRAPAWAAGEVSPTTVLH